MLVEALEQKNPDGTALPPGHPHTWTGLSRSLWGAGAPAAGSAPSEGSGDSPAQQPHRDTWVTCPWHHTGTCSHTEGREALPVLPDSVRVHGNTKGIIYRRKFGNGLVSCFSSIWVCGLSVVSPISILNV